MMAIDDLRPFFYPRGMMDVRNDQSQLGAEEKTTIHSGHFMVSRVHDVNNEEDGEEVTSPFDDSKGFDFFTAKKEPTTSYNFLNTRNSNNSQFVTIDASLTKLFECMTLAYSGKLTSPKWKQFRGLHLSQKQRIRLNNIIWREWHKQYIYGKGPMVCQFATPLSDHIHSKPEAVVLEGKYWKRQLDAVTSEYKKWRRYFKENVQQHQHINFQENRTLSEWELLERVRQVTFIPHTSSGYTSSTDLNLLHADITDMDFTNDLFASLNQPFAFPNPRELSQLGCADLIQPGLIQLQPNLEEVMDIDSMQEFFNVKMSSLSSAFMSDSSAVDMSLGGPQNTEMTLESFLRGSSLTASSPGSVSVENTPTSTVQVNNSPASFFSGGAGTSHNITFQLSPESHFFDPTIFLEASLSQSSPPTFTLVPSGVNNRASHLFGGSSSVQKQAVNSSPVFSSPIFSSSDLLAQLLEQSQSSHGIMLTSKKLLPQQSQVPIQPAPSLNRQPLQIFQPVVSANQSVHLSQPQSFQQLQQHPPTMTQPIHPHHHKLISTNKHGIKTGLSEKVPVGSLNKALEREVTQSVGRKKDGPFTVPLAKPVNAPRKNRTIAPAQPTPSPQQQSPLASSPSSQASYLAELLKSGTYPGALINVKKEPTSTSSPIKTTTNFYHHTTPSSYSSSSYIQTMGSLDTASSSPIQIGLASLCTAATSRRNSPLLTDMEVLENLGIPGNLASLDPCLPVGKESPVLFSHRNEPTLHSPVSLLSNSPNNSPPLVKGSSSPISAIDVTGFVDPASPFSSSITVSPSGLILDNSPDSPGSSDSPFPRETRKAAHLSAEQKRRCNLKTGFDMLQQLVPSLSQNPKVSKATMLQKTAEYCKKLKAERSMMHKESAILKQEIDALNSAISVVQSQLPETGAPVTRQRRDQMKEMFDEYVRLRTQENSKFWIFSMLMSSLYESYCNTVSTSNMEELCRTTLTWLDQSCSLVTLRPEVLNALRRLSTTTPILTEPQKMKEHALQAVVRRGKGQRGST